MARISGEWPSQGIFHRPANRSLAQIYLCVILHDARAAAVFWQRHLSRFVTRLVVSQTENDRSIESMLANRIDIRDSHDFVVARGNSPVKARSVYNPSRNGH